MPMAKILVFLPVVAAVTAQSMSPREGIKSILTELIVVLVFLGTWSLTRFFMSKKEKPDELKDAELAMTPVKVKKTAKSKSPDELAEVIVKLCAEQFTRGLRMYREMVKNDQDKLVTGDGFFMSLIEASVRVGKPDVALQVLDRMLENGTVPTPSFVESALKLFAARKLHSECVAVWTKFGDQIPPHQVILSCVAVAACEIGQADLGKQLLDIALANFVMPSREWLAVMRHHARKHDWRSAVADMKKLMAHKMPIDNILFNTVLAVCAANEEAVDEMPALLAEMKTYQTEHPASEPTVDIVTYNTLLKALARRGDVKACFELFEAVSTDGLQPDDVSFSTLLDVCIDEDEHQLASVALERMSTHGVQMNTIVMTTLMKGFVRSKRLDKAMQLYDSMRASASAVKPDMITYSMLIKAHCDVHDMGTALKVLEDMLESDCQVDDVVFTILIEGCCQVNNIRLAEKLFKDMVAAKIKPSIYTLNGLVKIYGKSSQSHLAVDIVKNMEAEHGIKPTVVVYTCLMSGLIRTKKFKEAWQIWQLMVADLQPDHHSFQTMIQGLADGGMWTELVQLAPKYVESVSKFRSKQSRADLGVCLNGALSTALNRNQVAVARSLQTLMTDNGFEVTVAQAKTKLDAQ